MNAESSRTHPLPVLRALTRLGSDLRDARRRRRIPTSVLAGRAFISRTTLVKVEKADAGVSIGIYAAVLSAPGLLDRLAELADVRSDTLGLDLEEERLPQRVRLRRSRP